MGNRNLVTLKDETVWEGLQTSGFTHRDVSIFAGVSELASREAIALGCDGSRRLVPRQATVYVAMPSLLDADSVAGQAKTDRDVLPPAPRRNVRNAQLVHFGHIVAFVVWDQTRQVRVAFRTGKVPYPVSHCSVRCWTVRGFWKCEVVNARVCLSNNEQAPPLLGYAVVGGV
jgi:hypothetical protein